MTASTRLLVLLNPMAGRTCRAWPQIKDELARQKISYEMRETEQSSDCEQHTRRALYEGYTTIAAVGGDGTLSGVAAGFFEPQPLGDAEEHMPLAINPMASLAVLPAGTGNDFARSLAGSRASLESWLKRLIAHYHAGASATTSRRVDVLSAKTSDTDDTKAQRFVCLNAATLGLGAEVAGRVAGHRGLIRRFPGEVRFALAALGALARWRNRPVRVQIDHVPALECNANLLVVANNLYAGGGMMLAPAARSDDGQLDVVVLCGATRRSVVRELGRVHRGGHVSNPQVRTFRGTCVRIEAVAAEDQLPIEVDGDPRGYTPVEFRVVPAALRIVV